MKQNKKLSPKIFIRPIILQEEHNLSILSKLREVVSKLCDTNGNKPSILKVAADAIYRKGLELKRENEKIPDHEIDAEIYENPIFIQLRDDVFEHILPLFTEVLHHNLPDRITQKFRVITTLKHIPLEQDKRGIPAFSQMSIYRPNASDDVWPLISTEKQITDEIVKVLQTGDPRDPLSIFISLAFNPKAAVDKKWVYHELLHSIQGLIQINNIINKYLNPAYESDALYIGGYSVGGDGLDKGMDMEAYKRAPHEVQAWNASDMAFFSNFVEILKQAISHNNTVKNKSFAIPRKNVKDLFIDLQKNINKFLVVQNQVNDEQKDERREEERVETLQNIAKNLSQLTYTAAMRTVNTDPQYIYYRLIGLNNKKLSTELAEMLEYIRLYLKTN